MRKILVVVNAQNDFVSGVLAAKDAKSVVPKIFAKMGGYPVRDIVFVRDSYEDGQASDVPHCIKGTEGWRFCRELSAAANNVYVFDKASFGSPALAEALAEVNAWKPLQVEIVGFRTEVCVLSNALLLKTAMPNVDITVDASCCAGATAEGHAAALTVMEACGIKVINK